PTLQSATQRHWLAAIVSEHSPNFALFPPPAFRERRHRRLARRFIAMCERATFVMPEGECPHPWRAYGRGGGVEDTADDNAICKHVEVVLAPLAGCAGRRGAFENEIVLLHRWQPKVAFCPAYSSPRGTD